jgi:dTDP-4-amino-4,6-dideoxygalactose transaminase
MEQVERVNIAIRYFPVHLLAEMRALGHRYGECPVAEEQYFERQIQLPIYGHLTDAQIEHMIGAVHRAVEKLGRLKQTGCETPRYVALSKAQRT